MHDMWVDRASAELNFRLSSSAESGVFSHLQQIDTGLHFVFSTVAAESVALQNFVLVHKDDNVSCLILINVQ